MKTAILLSALLFVQATVQAQGIAPVSKDAMKIANYLLTPEARSQIQSVQKDSVVKDITETRLDSREVLNVTYTFPWGDNPTSDERGMGFILVDHKTDTQPVYQVAWTQCACGNTDDRDPLDKDQRLLDSDAVEVAQILLNPEVDRCLKGRKLTLIDIKRLKTEDVDKFLFSFDAGTEMLITRSYELGANGKGQMTYKVSCNQ